MNSAGEPRAYAIGSLYFLAVLNGFAVEAVNSIRVERFWSAVYSTFGISVVSIGAVVCGLMLLRRSSGGDIGRLDVAIGALSAVLLLAPHRAAAWGAVTLLAVYELTRPSSSNANRTAAMIFLALAASEFWVPVILQASGNLWLSWDAALVAALLRSFVSGPVIQTGNVVSSPYGGSVAIVVGCASLTNVAYGLLCWLIIAKGLRPEWRRRDGVAIGIVAASVVVLNVGRVTLMTGDPDDYALVHGALGADVFNLVLLAVSGAVAVWSIRDAPSSVGSSLGAAGGR